MTTEAKPKRKIGFAAMDPARQRQIAASGGLKAWDLRKAHAFTPEEAVAAGKRSQELRRAKLKSA